MIDLENAFSTIPENPMMDKQGILMQMVATLIVLVVKGTQKSK